PGVPIGGSMTSKVADRLRREPPQESSEYPRTYRTSPSYRLMSRALALVLLTVAVVGIIGRGMARIGPPMTPFRIVFFGGLLIGVAVKLWVDTARRVTLHEDRIEVTSWTRTRGVSREEIRGRRFVRGYRGVSIYVL